MKNAINFEKLSSNILSVIRSFALPITLIIIGNGANAETQYPCLMNGNSNPDCQLILQDAKIAFQSTEPYLYNAAAIIRKKDQSLVLWPAEATDKTAEFFYELKFDTKHILSANGAGGAAKKIFLQKKSINNSRFAVRQRIMNWKGDWFDLMLIKSTKNPDQIMKLLQNLEQDVFCYGNKPPVGVQAIDSDMWQYPWLFYNQNTDHYLAVDTQPPYVFFADWNIYACDKNGNKIQIGKIQFKPPAKDGFHAIPAGPLHNLAILLDQIIGKSQSEGTYNPLDYLRGDVENMWGNLLYRPWAIAQPSNSRPQVERHLKKWAKGSSVYRKQYAELQSLYPKALIQLIAYYEQHFCKSHAEATAMATKSLDLALRSHFRLN